MIPLKASHVAQIVSGRLVGDDVTITGNPFIDSRQCQAGGLFVALVGERVDGHDYLPAVAEQGAAAGLVTRPVYAHLAQILVADAVAALSQLARYIANQAARLGCQIIALTGSSGKTSTKDLLAQILEPVAKTVSPKGSFNNILGLPLTVASVDLETRFLVAEMGASEVGHIAWLCSIAQPTIAAVLNIGQAHLGEFGSQAAIAQAKGEIIEDLPADGWAILNADDPLVAGLSDRTKARLAWFSSTNQPCQTGPWVGAEGIRLDDLGRASFRLIGQTLSGSFDLEVSLQTLGAHQVINATAAAAMALAAGASANQVATGLNQAVARSAWRMEARHMADGTLVLNDAYNANPNSMTAALNSLRHLMAVRPEFPAYAVLGDMLELGSASVEAHQSLGRQAAEIGATVIAVGQFASDLADGVRLAGGQAVVLSADDVADWLISKATGIILVKGSRGVGLETIVDQLLATRGEET